MENVADAISQMLMSMKHRGPNHGGVRRIIVNDRRTSSLIMGHTRLSIIDLSSAGHQPMHDPETGNWIVYNGEIYNFREIREELDQRAVTGESEAMGRDRSVWRSRTDTEVILKAYAEWGRACVDKFRGMFAFALWDASRQELWCVRDRLGIKPFYYTIQPDTFAFASEVRTLLASGIVAREVDLTGLESFLRFGAVQEPCTIVKGVHGLLPGHWLRVNTSGEIVEEHCYWSLYNAFTDQKSLLSTTETKFELRRLFEEAVQLRLISDVPLGAFLSGGIDSSAVVALMTHARSCPVKTFSVVFREKDKQNWNEAAYSSLVARKFSTAHTEIDLTEDQIFQWIPDALASMDQPTMDGINTWVISKVTREAGVTVALSGLGGDELFAGYPSFKRALLMERSVWKAIWRLPRRARTALARCMNVCAGNDMRIQKLADLLASSGSALDLYNASRNLFPSQILTRLLCTLPRKNNPEHVDNKLNAEVMDWVNTISCLELSGYMANMLLRDTDVMSMAHSLEVRVPLIDHKLVEFVASLPGESKLKDVRLPKPLLVEAMGDDFPDQIARRPKMGFTLPFEQWMRGPLKGEMEDVFYGSWFEPGIHESAVKRVWQAFLKGKHGMTWSRPWALFVLAKWCQRNRVALPSSSLT